MATITRHRRLAIATSIALAALAVAAIYAFAAAAQPRPVTGKISLNVAPNGETCGTNSFVIELEGQGTLAQLGRVNILASNCARWLGEPLASTAEIVDGVASYTTADGATLSVTYDGSQTVPVDGVFHVVVSQEVTAGTGRLAGATGGWTIEGTVDLNTGILVGDVTGWLQP